ncbi:MAG: HAD family hydrolase [Candidatus Omnitrophica bacterium]|nr:HAD family hydrolase [Candidatus Omnitrophota bacterium]
MKRIVFLDRDGVINKNPVYLDYIRKPSQFKFLPGAEKAIRLLTEAGFDIYVVSNQSGVEKGLFTRQDLKAINDKMIKAVEASGGRILKSYYCTHLTVQNCSCKKPKTAFIKKAIGKRRVDRKNSYFIGDTERDIIAGKRAGLRAIAVLSGYTKKKDIRGWKAKPDFIAKNLLKAVKEIIV